MTTRVGIPRTLAYYSFYPEWQTYLEELGMEVILSPPTTKDVLDMGIRYTVTDACIPIKSFHGHVAALIGSVDYILIPRLVSVDGQATFCPKFLGLPEMVEASVKDLPPLLTPRLDVRDGRFAPMRAWLEVAKSLGVGKCKALSAYRSSLRVGDQYESLLAQGMLPEEAMALAHTWWSSAKNNGTSALPEHETGIPTAKAEPKTKGNTDPNANGSIRLGLVGYPYAIYDKFTSCDLMGNLARLGVRILTPEMVPAKHREAQALKQPKNLFWYYSNQIMRATYYFLEKQLIDGLIHVTAFGCGPDAMVDKLLELDCRKYGRLPFLSLALDEHTGVAGVMTRLEAFVDMLTRRKVMLNES
ncbi:MAG: 2-hydroxyglutaryl-CoA dehydratase [Firmicutes bacterium]|nr:2-hydroxyglutaryl-CoA dehydratase [Bacillota bacterium]